MELRQIRFAVAVAEDRHFGRAAERMYIAQPALSQHVRRLERELGARLFDRGARHVRVTPAGEAFLEVARHILRQADEAAAAARRAEAGETGSVSLGASLPVAAPVLSLLLRRWATARPQVRPMLSAGRSRELVDLVRRRELDLVLVEGSPTEVGLRSTWVVDDPIVVLVQSHHPLARHDEIDVDALAETALVTVTRERWPDLHDRLITACTTAGFAPRVGLELDDPHLVPVAVGAGLGAALVPRSVATASAQDGVVSRPLRGDVALPLSAVTADDGGTPQALALLDLLVDLRDRRQLRQLRQPLGRHLELARGPDERTAS